MLVLFRHRSCHLPHPERHWIRMAHVELKPLSKRLKSSLRVIVHSSINSHCLDQYNNVTINNTRASQRA